MMTSVTLGFIFIKFSYKFINGQQGKKDGQKKVQKLEYLKNQETFFGKKHFFIIF